MWPLTPVQNAIETLFMIPNKQGEIVPFRLNSVQKVIHDDKALRKDILKSRQFGISYFVLAAFLVNCILGFCRAVIIAHDKDHTEKLLARVHLLIKLMRGPKPVTSKANEHELLFDKTNASFYIGTAGTRTFGRSDTITHLHGSEVAFWPEPKKLIAGLMQAVPHNTGCVIKECTANGYGTYHHRSFMNAWMHRSSRFKAIFLPWYIFKEYSSPSTEGFILNAEELILRDIYEKYALDVLKRPVRISNDQWQWRREKVEEFEGDVRTFNQEYPGTVDEAFLVTGGSLFPEVLNIESEEWQKASFSPGKLFKHIAHPVEGYHYVFGSDVSGGTGNDFSTLVGLCVETQEQVLVYYTNTVKPPSFATTLVELITPYGEAPYLVPELNQHGLSLVDCLESTTAFREGKIRIYASRYSRQGTDYGFKTTSQSKYPLIGTLIKILPLLQLYDGDTVDQLRGFGETEEGKLGNVEASNDDLVIALALACLGLQKEFMNLGITPGQAKEEVKAPERKGFQVTLEDIKSRIKTGQSDLWLPSHLARHADVRHSNSK